MNNDILKLYVNKNLMSNSGMSYVPLLFPFLGQILKESTPYVSAVFKKHNFDKSYYGLTDDIKEADFVLLPYNYWNIKLNNPILLDKFIKEAESNEKQILIVAYGDTHDPINVKNSVILRSGQYKKKLNSNDIIIPAYADDLLESYCDGAINIRNKTETPIIGFMGYAGQKNNKDYFKALLKEIPIVFSSIFNKKYLAHQKGIFLRKKALKILNKSVLIKTNFKIRKFYSGHLKTIEGNVEDIRREFIANILDSDYALCVKGDGNFSYRFYEALSLGRIPLFVNTDCVLPLESLINYKEFCVFVDVCDLQKIDKIIRKFHDSIDDRQFKMMQKKAREVFEKYLRIDVFTRYLVEELNKFLIKK